MAIQGLRNTTNFATDERPLSWREGILLQNPNGMAPITALTAAMKDRAVDDAEYNWWDKKLQSRRAALGTSITSSASDSILTLASGGKAFKEGDLLYVENTGEVLRVSADPTIDTSITVERGFAGTSKAAVTITTAGVNPNLLCIGSAYEEGSLAPTGVNFDPTKRYNYTQIFRNTLEMTRTASKTRLRTGDQVKEAKRECLELHSMDMERAFWLGVKSEGTKNGQPIRTCDGIIAQIAAGNKKDAAVDHSTGVTMEGLEEYLFEMFRWGSQEKMGFCGNRALLTIQQIIRKNSDTNFSISDPIKEMGMNVRRLICPFGELVLKTHPLWNYNEGGVTGGTAYYGMNSWLIALDMAEAKYVYVKGSDTQYQKKLESNDLDGMKSGYLSECSLELHLADNHYFIKNLVLAAVDS